MQLRKERSKCFLEENTKNDVMVSPGRKIFHKEFGNPQCQVLQRKQRPVSFGSLGSFLFSLLPIQNEDKRERSWKISIHQSHLLTSWCSGSKGKGRQTAGGDLLCGPYLRMMSLSLLSSHTCWEGDFSHCNQPYVSFL